MHRASYNTPPTTTIPLQALHSLASQLGHMQVMVLIWAKSGLNLGQTYADSGLKPGPSLSHNKPSCSRPRFSPRWVQTVTEKPYPSPPSELPPLEETGGQWLAFEAKGLRDRISFINGKVSLLIRSPDDD